MSQDTKSYVSAEELEKLQREILNIKDKINELRETVSTAISAVGEEWQDSKYEEFVDAYSEYKKTMEQIEEEYQRYASEVLPPFIEKAKEYDSHKMSM